MKQITLTFILLLGLSFTPNLHAQNSIGLITGISVGPELMGKEKNHFNFSEKNYYLHSIRLGIRGNVKIGSRTSIEVGYDRYNESFQIDIGADIYNYSLSYIQIPLLYNLNLYSPEFNRVGGTKIGLSTDILKSEVINAIPSQDTDFNKIVVSPTAAVFYGFQTDYIRIVGVINLQLSANSIINKEVLGSNIRTFDTSVFINAAFVF